MSDREQAEAWLFEWVYPQTGGSLLVRDALTNLLTAARDAALEEAAREVERGDWGDLESEAEVVAARIRALKHG